MPEKIDIFGLFNSIDEEKEESPIDSYFNATIKLNKKDLVLKGIGSVLDNSTLFDEPLHFNASGLYENTALKTVIMNPTTIGDWTRIGGDYIAIGNDLKLAINNYEDEKENDHDKKGKLKRAV